MGHPIRRVIIPSATLKPRATTINGKERHIRATTTSTKYARTQNTLRTFMHQAPAPMERVMSTIVQPGVITTRTMALTMTDTMEPTMQVQHQQLQQVPQLVCGVSAGWYVYAYRASSLVFSASAKKAKRRKVVTLLTSLL